MKRWWISLAFAFLASAAYALPTVADVQAEVQKGNYSQAETMMHDVVAAKPGSARAHYVYAEILAHNERFALAAEETARARQLDPSLKFAEPEKFRAFEQLLEREQQRSRADTSALGRPGPSGTSAAVVDRPLAPLQRVEERQASSGLPGWVLPVGLVLLAFVAWRMLRRSTGAATPAPLGGTAGYGTAGYGTGMPYGPGPGYGPGAPQAGSGLLGVGLAAAGGVAAGMLAEKLLDGGHEQRSGDAFYDRPFDSAPGAGRDDAAAALEDRNIDFGTGNDWGDGGSVDVGGGSDDGSW